ncbi:MAG: response regulator [Bacteroidetes bacterium]|nr:response regulator [Bacteroidota bacterium]
MIRNKEKEILIVEDDPCYAFILEKTLSIFFNTTIVTSGYAALNAIEENIYDAILMDTNLGDANMDGLKTMLLIKQSNKHRGLKIFAMTAFSDAREWYMKQGFEDLFIKPIENERIINLLKIN